MNIQTTPSSTTANHNYTDKEIKVIEQTLETYINRFLRQDCADNNNEIQTIIKFQGYCPNTKRLFLLIGGTCPYCQFRHVRNICNANLCKDLLTNIFHTKFPKYVDKVLPISTHHPNFESYAEGHGYKVVHYDYNKSRPISELQNIIFNGFPEATCHLKGDYPKNDDITSPAPKNSALTMNQYLFFYDICYFITPGFKAATIMGEVAETVEDLELHYSNGGFPPNRYMYLLETKAKNSKDKPALVVPLPTIYKYVYLEE